MLRQKYLLLFPVWRYTISLWPEDADAKEENEMLAGTRERPWNEGNRYGVPRLARLAIVVIPKRNTNGAFLAGVINSKAMNCIYHVLFGSLSLAGGYLRFGPPQLRVLPIPPASDDDQKNIEGLVQKCMDAKGVGCEELEKQIDQLVYKLYGLTPDEIAIVEGNQ